MQYSSGKMSIRAEEMHRAGAIIVTGGSRGLGRGIALELARTGWSVVIQYHTNHEAAKETATEWVEVARAAGHENSEIMSVSGDIADPEDREKLVTETLQRFGAIAGLVNNAGVAPDVRADITEATEESFHRLMTTNLQGPYFLTQRVAQHMLQHTTDALRHIVFITSISAATASINRGDYCISKAGLAMAAQLWAARLAQHGINVYEVRPGIMKTDMTARVQDTYSARIAEGLVPQRRWGTPKDIGSIVRAIMDGDLGFSTGAVINADGGFSISQL